MSWGEMEGCELGKEDRGKVLRFWDVLGDFVRDEYTSRMVGADGVLYRGLQRARRWRRSGNDGKVFDRESEICARMERYLTPTRII